jgi:hypothetical protein
MTQNKKSLPIPRRATSRAIIHPNTGEMLDNALTLWFPGKEKKKKKEDKIKNLPINLIICVYMF